MRSDLQSEAWSPSSPVGDEEMSRQDTSPHGLAVRPYDETKAIAQSIGNWGVDPVRMGRLLIYSIPIVGIGAAIKGVAAGHCQRRSS